jgi:hypothetical protein
MVVCPAGPSAAAALLPLLVVALFAGSFHYEVERAAMEALPAIVFEGYAGCWQLPARPARYQFMPPLNDNLGTPSSAYIGLTASGVGSPWAPDQHPSVNCTMCAVLSPLLLPYQTLATRLWFDDFAAYGNVHVSTLELAAYSKRSAQAVLQRLFAAAVSRFSSASPPLSGNGDCAAAPTKAIRLAACPFAPASRARRGVSPISILRAEAEVKELWIAATWLWVQRRQRRAREASAFAANVGTADMGLILAVQRAAAVSRSWLGQCAQLSWELGALGWLGLSVEGWVLGVQLDCMCNSVVVEGSSVAPPAVPRCRLCGGAWFASRLRWHAPRACAALWC